jgi:predicted Zn finger-like uncharacterized protein
LKFVCDKCKTRYSIGEERVRGKILKIRCKNCANVITVREGMEPAPEAPSAPRAAMTSSAALVPQTEWYVSIEGVQSGPMSLSEAERWIASKPFEADLHCWNDGFDDWLSVDKVSHFRNLRKPRAPSASRGTAPPPLPEKPLFAATMATIEKETSAPTHPQRPSAPSMAASAPVPAKRPTGPGLGAGSSSAQNAAAAARATAAKANGVGYVPSPSMQLPIIPPGAANPAPVARDKEAPQRARNAFDFGGGTGALPAIPAVEPEPVAPSSASSALDDDDNDGFAIGEVSRVVKLADLKPKVRTKQATGGAPTPAPRIGAATGSVGRISSPQFRTGSQPRMMMPSELGMNVDPALASAAGAPGAAESMVARSFRDRHRRGLLALIIVSAVLVLGVIGAVVFVVSRESEEIGGSLGGGTQIDTSRPEDIIRRQAALVESSGSAAKPTSIKRNTGKHVTNAITQVAEDPRGNSLQASEVEDMAAKQGEGTKRCYMRAQKGAMGFEIGDIKKIAVTLSVAKDGSVTNVVLSSHGTTSLGQCLIARIKGWKFRESPSGGTFRISLAFSS